MRHCHTTTTWSFRKMLVSQILNILSILAIAGRVGADLSPSMGDGDGGTVSSGNDGPSANSDTTKGNNTFDGANHDAKSSDRDEGGSNSGGGDDSNSGASSGNIESGGDVTSGHQSGTGAVSGEPVAADGKGESSVRVAVQTSHLSPADYALHPMHRRLASFLASSMMAGPILVDVGSPLSISRPPSSPLPRSPNTRP